MATYILGLSGLISSPFGAFHHRISHIPNQTTMYNQFAYYIPPNPPFLNPIHPTPQPIDPNSNQSQENIVMGESNGST